MLGAYIVEERERKQANLQFVYNLFPVLERRRNQATATMSGANHK
ncbi:MAG: hypothetical protein ACLP5H_31270 [Desulfomonilaceae bacterium]